MYTYKIYVKKSGNIGSMEKLWDVVMVEAESEEALNKKLGEFSKKGWKVFKISKI